MASPASRSKPWCEAWDRVSEGLSTELASPRPHPLRVRELIDRRQRLMTADPVPSPPDAWSEADRRRWLDRATRREEEIQNLFRKYRGVVQRAVDTFAAGERARKVYQDTVLPRPGRAWDDIA